MNCPYCGQRTLAHAGQPDEGWVIYDFCENCKLYLKPVAICKSCKHSYKDFSDSGYLGCEDCYHAFSATLIQQLSKLRKGFVAEFESCRNEDSLAHARTEEIRQALPYSRNIQPEQWQQNPAEKTQKAEPVSDPADCSLANEKNAQIPGKISFRIRVARNLQGISYSHWLKADRRLYGELEKRLISPGASPVQVLEKLERQPMRRLSLSEIEFLQKAGLPDVTGAIKIGQHLTVLTGDEDHIRLEWLYDDIGENESQLEDIFVSVCQKIEQFDDSFIWQWNQEFGFLTACPANSGSGIRVSFMITVPELHTTGLLYPWRLELERAGWEVRGQLGEGSRAGRTVQLSRIMRQTGNKVAAEFKKMMVIIDRILQTEKKPDRLADL